MVKFAFEIKKTLIEKKKSLETNILSYFIMFSKTDFLWVIKIIMEWSGI